MRCFLAGLWIVAIITAIALGGEAMAKPIRFYVALNGNDVWSGKLPKPNAAKTDGPFATLERARDVIRNLKAAGKLKTGAEVVVCGGSYYRDKPFELTAEDSGTADAPIIYCTLPGQEVRLIGGKLVTGWKPVTDPAVFARLDEAARGKVLQADLRALGITDFGPVKGGGLELFFQDKPMILARWPNKGFIYIVDVVEKDGHQIHGIPGSQVGKFIYEGERPQRWMGEKDAWLHGYWFWDWSDERQKIESIDAERHIISLVPPYHYYGYRKGQWFYAFNILAELDSPGEWYLDREAGILYFWPPAPLEKGRAIVSVLPTLVTMRDTSYIILRGFTLEAVRGTAVNITGGTHNQVVGCTIRNLGSWAAQISGGKANGVVGCDIYETGNGGIALDGGDRKTLTPARHFAENNHIHHYSRWNRMYQPAISLTGVGNRARHNLIHNAPHEAIAFSGNDHIIEFNEIHSVCYESNDAGAIYSGRDWTWRGTIIRHNFFHHISGFEGHGCVGVYLDDMLCGTIIYGNVFYKVTRATFIGGGRDNIVENNIFVDCKPAVHVDARALGWAKYHAETWIREGQEKGTLSGTPYKQPPYSERYPKLVNILEDEPAAPKGNIIARNICWGGQWDEIEGIARPMVRFEDNLLDKDPCFIDAAKMNFQLKDDSPAYRLGFKRIPIEKIGLYKDERRASWPVKHKVRQMPELPPAKQPARTRPAPVFKVVPASVPVVVDGLITPQEWAGADPARAMVIERGIEGEKVGLRSLAWLAYNSQHLFVAIDNSVDPSKPLRIGRTWGQDDAVEVALQNTAAGKDAPILVLRGYASGYWESSGEAGAPAAAVKRAAEGVLYGARIVNAGRWTAEWCIPFKSLGIDPKKHKKFAFNLSVRKTAQPIWVMWQGTGGYSWAVENAGFLVLAP